MKMPRISVQAIMALVIVVAADCWVSRAVMNRTMISNQHLILINTLPMANLLAVAVALWIGGRRTVGSFWAGFVAFGLLALIVSTLWMEAIAHWWEVTLTSAGLDAWIEKSSLREMIVEYGLAPGLLAFPQVVFASIGGGLNRLLGARRASPTEVAGPRRQRVALVALVALIGVPAVSVEVYLWWTVDCKIARLAANSEAIVIDQISQKMIALPPPKGQGAMFSPSTAPPPLANGTRLRVERDDETSIIQAVQDSRSKVTTMGDYRIVRAILLDGDQQGKSVKIPRCALEAASANATDSPRSPTSHR